MNKILRIILAAIWFVIFLIGSLKSQFFFTPILANINDGWGQIFAWLGLILMHLMLIIGVPFLLILGGFSNNDS